MPHELGAQHHQQHHHIQAQVQTQFLAQSPHPGSHPPPQPARQQSQHSVFAKAALMSRTAGYPPHHRNEIQTGSINGVLSSASAVDGAQELKPPEAPGQLQPTPRFTYGRHPALNGVGHALSDTPAPSAPSSPRIPPLKQTSGTSTPRVRPTTLDIPGLTKSKVSPDGKIAKRDVGSKLIIIMVGLPARGKSYITKKMARYLNWLQHDTKIFNVGEKRRIVAKEAGQGAVGSSSQHVRTPSEQKQEDARTAARILINGDAPQSPSSNIPVLKLPESAPPSDIPDDPKDEPANGTDGYAQPPPNAELEGMDQSAAFFDPSNEKANAIREQCAIDTLDELLHYILVEGGSVGILDATNSTLSRRKLIMDRIRAKAGPQINVLFVESVCEDETLLEANMRLKLSGPDYKDKDPVASLADFKKRVALYQQRYTTLGAYEENHNMPYVKIIDVGRKIISHQIRGFLSSQTVYYLLNFNLAPRQIWITRHGESIDNVLGKIGGDSDLSENGKKYGRVLQRFIGNEYREWEVRQHAKIANSHFPPKPGDTTPPNPYYSLEGDDVPARNFCVWTSMLKRSIQTAEDFDDEEYDVKQMRMLDELNAGLYEGMTYHEIKENHKDEYELRQRDKLSYRYPGPGGEGYLDVINRLRPVIVELERMTDHCLLITHRSVARVLLAYFMGLRRDQVADLDAPLGMLYSLEPKAYGVELKAYRYNAEKEWFDYLPEFELRKAVHPHP